MNGPIEPPADIRQGAAQLWLTFLALMQEGFNEKQALTIIGQRTRVRAHESR